MATSVATASSSIFRSFQTWGVGNTPLLEISGVSEFLSERVRLFAKAEWVNPGGSVKDRAALAMILEALASGALRPGKTLLDATSGNTGVAYAWIGARLGYPVTLAVPASINEERKKVLLAYGAKLELTDPLQGSDGAILEARRLFEGDPERYFYPDQYANPLNWRAHFETTGREIWEQTAGAVTHFVAGLGTSGTFVGTGRRLREFNPKIGLVSIEPDSPFHGLEGLKHMASAIVPPIYDARLATETLEASTEDAQRWVRRLSRRGILAGISSGAALSGALQVCRRLAQAGEAGTVVTVFPDSGERYLNEPFWKDAE
ncbi:MAG: cysteine synthase family protein [Elusimicrobia bacterium]|nr:cysteine synthase family protein [Elusimicrobiota bacterium]